MLGGSSFQVTTPIFCFSNLSAIVGGIVSFFLDDDEDDEDFVVDDLTLLMMLLLLILCPIFCMRLLLGGGSMRMGLIPCVVGFGDVCLSVLRVTCGSVILVASWICDTCVHLGSGWVGGVSFWAVFFLKIKKLKN